jgi:nucleotide-binding universal stress UspA family protein
MKVLVGYDGSVCSDIAIKDLQRAGLPDTVEAVVLTVTDDLSDAGWSNKQFPIGVDCRISAGNAAALATQLVEEAAAVARVGSSLLQGHFPSWSVQPQIMAELPAWGLLSKAAEFEPDLLVVGTQRHPGPFQKTIGKVASTVLCQAPCTIRIARDHGPGPQRPLRILVGIDGSTGADDAAKVVAQRKWPIGSDIHLVMALDTTLCARPAPVQIVGAPYTCESETDAQERAEQILESVKELIVAQNPALTISTHVLYGEPKHVLLEEAERWGADSIFLGARGESQNQKQTIGGVALTVATRAHCSVEIVRVGLPAPL